MNANKDKIKDNDAPQKPKRIIDWIKYRNMKEATINYTALTGLKRVNKILTRLIKFSILGFIVGYGSFTLYNHYNDIFENRIKNLEELISKEGDDEKKIVYLNNHIKLGLEYGDDKEMDAVEDKTGITYYREKLLKNATGLVLETCSGSFRNKEYYPDTVKNIIAVDWCKDILNFAFAHTREDTKFVVMDCTNLEYMDNSFDTIVDTFGLQASHNHQKQFEEMKRVCKVGGKILLLEMGESLWKSTNYKILCLAFKEFSDRGQHLYRNWDHLILNDSSVKIVNTKRKINGCLYYYELEKLY